MRFIFIFLMMLSILEVWLLLKVGSIIGGWSTFGLIVLSAVLGIALLRQQSLSTVLRARSKLEQGAPPTREMIEGVFLAVGGILLLLPGLITDVLGFCCLLPGVRRGIIGWGLRRAARRRGKNPHQQGSKPGHTIEGEYRREDDSRK